MAVMRLLPVVGVRVGFVRDLSLLSSWESRLSDGMRQMFLLFVPKEACRTEGTDIFDEVRSAEFVVIAGGGGGGWGGEKLFVRGAMGGAIK